MFNRKQISPFDSYGEKKLTTASPRSVVAERFFSTGSLLYATGLIATLVLIAMSSMKLILLGESIILAGLLLICITLIPNIANAAKLVLSGATITAICMVGTILFHQTIYAFFILTPLLVGLLCLWCSYEEFSFVWDFLTPSLLGGITTVISFFCVKICDRKTATGMLLVVAMLLVLANVIFIRAFSRMLTSELVESYKDMPVALNSKMSKYFSYRLVVLGLSVAALITELLMFFVKHYFLSQLPDFMYYCLPIIGMIPFIIYGIIKREDVTISYEAIFISVLLFIIIMSRESELILMTSLLRTSVDFISIFIVDFVVMAFLYIYKRRRLVNERNMYFKGLPLMVLMLSIVFAIVELMDSVVL